MILSCLILSSAAQAKVLQDRIVEADNYYQQGEYKKAYKSYFKLAKTGDHYSQYRVAQMFAHGQGTKIDYTQAYAWSMLAQEGNKIDMEIDSNELLQQVDDKVDAQRKTEKLMKKYGNVAQAKRARQKEKRRNSSGSCTGSRLACYQG